MQTSPATPTDYINQLPAERKAAIQELRNRLLRNLPEGFEEVMSNGMLGYVVPHSLYPGGYHVNPAHPLRFINLASQKNYIALYHMALYVNKPLLEWFQEAWATHSNTKMDMGKSCIRFKKTEEIPYQDIGELAAKINPQEWIYIYEKELRK
ncbi:hypothetical protein D770_26430 [Flammeovirgaceae bacterium 311]|nr:hypothetical protein D770_26430 [Flammeovirgaceae bacterium 311]